MGNLNLFNKLKQALVQNQWRSLFELVILLAIIIFLSTSISSFISETQATSLDIKRMNDINDIKKALELYSVDQGLYPFGYELELGDVNNQCLSVYGFTPLCPVEGERVYLSFVPSEPDDTWLPYIYNSSDEGTSYTVEFELKTKIGDVIAGYHILTPQGIQ